MSEQKIETFQLSCMIGKGRAGAPQMTELSLKANHLSVNFQSVIGTEVTFGLRPDVHDFLIHIYNRCTSRIAKGYGDVRADNFVAKVGNVRLENLCVTFNETGKALVALRVICPGHLTLFQSEENEKNIDCFEEIFLPLTNLSAYLHAMEPQPSSQGPRQAARLTAERIDEFLLRYGQRLQDDLWRRQGKGGQ